MRLTTVLLAAALLALAPQARAGNAREFTENFPVDECTFSDTGRNPYFSLQPGDRLVLEAEEPEGTLVLQITVLKAVQWVTFRTTEGETLSVRTRVVEEREWLDGEPVEVSRNFYARCQPTNDIYYFGEEVDIYEGGVVVSHDGAWRAGANGAQPGIIMPGSFLLGSRYFQELAPGVALDRAEHVAMDLEMDVPAGVFDECVEIVETTPLEPRAEDSKIYCAEIGLVVDSDAELVEYDVAGADEAKTEASSGARPGRD